MFTIKKENELYKLTYLSFFLNPKETQNEHNNEINNIKKEGKRSCKKYKTKFIDNLSIDVQKYKKTPFPYIEFCLNFKEKGYYFIELFSYNSWPRENTKAFRFFVNLEKEGMKKCIEHLFKEINEDELNIIKKLRKDIGITRVKVENFKEGQEGKMIVVNHYIEMETEHIAEIKPLFNEETFKYSNPDIYEENKKRKENIVVETIAEEESKSKKIKIFR